jgi:hypothetical protein
MAPLVTLRRLVEQTKLRPRTVGWPSLGRRKDSNRIAGGNPVDLIAGLDAVLPRDCLRHRHLNLEVTFAILL